MAPSYKCWSVELVYLCRCKKKDPVVHLCPASDPCSTSWGYTARVSTNCREHADPDRPGPKPGFTSSESSPRSSASASLPGGGGGGLGQQQQQQGENTDFERGRKRAGDGSESMATTSGLESGQRVSSALSRLVGGGDGPETRAYWDAVREVVAREGDPGAFYPVEEGVGRRVGVY